MTKKIKSIGYLSDDKLHLIPIKYRKMHEFCFYLHDIVLKAMVDYEKGGIHRIVSDVVVDLMNKNDITDTDLIEILRKLPFDNAYKHHLASHLIFGLVSDAINFIYESLCSFEKRKFSVGFSLLRKPIKENLLFLAWILGDMDSFIAGFENEPFKDLNGIKQDQRIKILKKAIDVLPFSQSFDAELLEKMIFSKGEKYGLEPAWQKGTHLITSYGENLKTGKYSINFIFDDCMDDAKYEILYRSLPYIMLFFIHISLASFNKLARMDEKQYFHAILCSLGCYEALFFDRKEIIVSKFLNESMGSLMKCVNCNKYMKITKNNAPTLYLMDKMICSHCGLDSLFPFYWLLSKFDIKFDCDTKFMSIIGEL